MHYRTHTPSDCNHINTHAIRILVQRCLCLTPSVPARLNQMKQKSKAVREKESFCLWRAAPLPHLCAGGPSCCTSGHTPSEGLQLTNIASCELDAKCASVCVCVCVWLMHDSEAHWLCVEQRLKKIKRLFIASLQFCPNRHGIVNKHCLSGGHVCFQCAWTQHSFLNVTFVNKRILLYLKALCDHVHFVENV